MFIAAKVTDLKRIRETLESKKYEAVIRAGEGKNTSVWVRDLIAEAVADSGRFTEVKSQIDNFRQFNPIPANATYKQTLGILGDCFPGNPVVDAGENPILT